MPKTRNAFALKDFDETKIFQRPFFNFIEVDGDYFLKNNERNDKDIFRELSATDDINKNELNLRKYQTIQEKLLYYQNLIDRIHLPRLVRLKRTTEDTEIKKRVDELRDFYDEYANKITITSAFVEEQIKKLEKVIQQQNKNIFASRLKQARKEKNISQRDLSDLTGINRADIGLYETGKKFPSLDNFIKILRCTGFSADWLLGMER